MQRSTRPSRRMLHPFTSSAARSSSKQDRQGLLCPRSTRWSVDPPCLHSWQRSRTQSSLPILGTSAVVSIHSAKPTRSCEETILCDAPMRPTKAREATAGRNDPKLCIEHYTQRCSTSLRWHTRTLALPVSLATLGFDDAKPSPVRTVGG